MMKTRASLTRTLRAQDQQGKEFLIEEYKIDKEVITKRGPQWQQLECFLFLDGYIVKYCEDDDTFLVLEKNRVLKHVS